MNSLGSPQQVGTPLPCSAVDTVEALRAGRAAHRALEVRELELAAHFADLNGRVDSSHAALPGTERLVVMGGDGTPAVAEFATLELAAALGVRDVEARSLVADALDLRHRLPAVWQLVLSGHVDAWKGRRLASITRPLDAHHAALVDLQLARSAPGLGLRRLETLAEGLVLEHLPAAEADARREAARDAHGVWISQGVDGIADLSAVVDAPDGLALEATVTQISRILAAGGVPGDDDARRAQALGILATPARALQLQQASLLDEPAPAPALFDDGTDVGAPCPAVGQPGHVCGTIDERIDPERLLPRASVVVHLTDTTLADAEGPIRADGLRPLLADWLRDLFGTHRIVVRPVIDANRQVPSDAYECPPTMREAVELRSPCEVFPWSTRRSSGLDLDHTRPFRRPTMAATNSPPSDDGASDARATPGSAPPTDAADPLGQTRPDNLGPLTRKVHRAKTHAGWRVEQPLPGIFLWQSPLGYRYLVTPSRTLDLGRPDALRSMTSLTSVESPVALSAPAA